jgi:hypothetical protein
MGYRFKNRFADCWLRNYSVTEGMAVAFRITTDRLSVGQRKTIEKMFRQGYGIGGQGNSAFIYEAYLKAAGPQHAITYGPNGLAFWFKDKARRPQFEALATHMIAAAKLTTDIQVPDIKKCAPDYCQAFLEPGYAYQGWNWCTPKLPAKLFVNSLYEHIERDPANDRGLAMFRANVPLIGRLRHVTDTGVASEIIEHLKVTVLDRAAAEAALSQAGLADQIDFIQG